MSAEEKEEDFTVVKSEAAMLQRTRQFEKSIKRYSKALELAANDKNCLVNRSRCHLALGDTRKALNDAESSLVDDKSFHRGIFQKAEAMYYKGDFELALVYYHRGNKLRPDLPEFRLGIQKAQEAIENSVGTPERVKLNTTGDLAFFTEQVEKPKKRRNVASHTRFPTPQKRDFKRTPAHERTIKEMLGELYGDKLYLEKILKKSESNTKIGKAVHDLAEEGVTYLDTRTDFWRQQKPMYARRYERNLCLKRYRSRKAISDDYIMGELEKIDEAQSLSRYKESLRRAQRCLLLVEGYTEVQLSNKNALRAQLHSCMGNASLELGQYNRALYHHQEDKEIGERCYIEEAESRGLDNMGRVYARMGEFERAINVWDSKLSKARSPIEITWLCHEIGRCHLELERPEKAHEYGEHSLSSAKEAGDKIWQLHATVLVAQSAVMRGELTSAYATFQSALDLLRELESDSSVKVALEKAMQDIKDMMNSQSSEGINADKKTKNHSSFDVSEHPPETPAKRGKEKRSRERMSKSSMAGNENQRAA